MDIFEHIMELANENLKLDILNSDFEMIFFGIISFIA
jgi:hypothetical protein